MEGAQGPKSTISDKAKDVLLQTQFKDLTPDES
jgi:hypothetical protein